MFLRTEVEAVATGYSVYCRGIEKVNRMSWTDQVMDELGQRPCCGYRQDDSPASEPTALSAMALAACGRPEPARRSADFLAEIQNADGSVGIRAEQETPRWPTGLAVLAWLSAGDEPDESANRYESAIQAAVGWILAFRSETSKRSEDTGHDTMLAAWPWVEGTHSWVEPTAIQLTALRATGHGDHPRAREAVKLLLDRQLVCGGWNYGNTTVLGRLLRPHMQPTGTALLALAGKSGRTEHLAKSLGYLRRRLSGDTPAVSLSWSLQGLAAHREIPKDSPENSQEWLQAAYRRPGRIAPSQYRSSLIALASLGEASPLVSLPRRKNIA